MSENKKANIHRKSTGRKMLDMFVTGDPTKAKEHLVNSIINGFMETAWSSIRSAVEIAVFGKSVGGGGLGRSGGGGYTSYDLYSKEYRDNSEKSIPVRRYRRYDSDGITFNSKDVAEKVLNNLYVHLDTYPSLSIADYYEIVSLICDADIPTSFTDNQWGWRKLSNIQININQYNEYVIMLPEPEPLRRY